MSVTLHCKNSGALPTSASRERNFSAACALMSTNATFDPWWQKCSTMLSPMPVAPPVTNTTLPFKLG